MALEDKYNRALLTKAELKNVLNKYGGEITDETVFREYPVIAQQLLESGGVGGGSAVLQEKTITENGVYTPDEGFDGFSKVAVNVESGASGDLPTLFAPSIKFSASDGMLAITDGGNGNFAVKYALYADEVYQGETAEKSIKITDFIQPTETQTIIIKMLAKSSNFKNSAFSNSVKWDYIAVSSGTVGLAYTLSSDGSYYSCSGIGTATETDIEIGNSIDGIGVTEISRQAFLNCTSLTSVKIPSSITKINFNAFGGCNGLTSVEIPDSVTYIGNMVFMDCKNLISAKLSNNVSNLQSYTFSGCSSLTSVELPNLTELGTDMFTSCKSLKNIVIPNTVTKVAGYVFTNCSSLKRVDFSNHTAVPTLSSTNVFRDTHADLQIKVPASLIDSWKTATNWSAYADKIVTEFTNEV
jgi:hypothetical protein